MRVELTPELWNKIEEEIDSFNKRTSDCYKYELEVEDVLYSMTHTDDKTFRISNDWNEGESNDPFWDKERDKHCIEVFLFDITQRYRNYGYL